MMQLGPMARPRLQQHPPSSPRRDIQSSNGNGSGYSQGAAPGSQRPTPSRDAKKTETPLGAPPINEGPPRASVGIPPPAVRPSARNSRTIPPPRPRRSGDTHPINGRPGRLFARGPGSQTSSHFTSEPTSTLPGDDDSTDDSEDKIDRVSGPVARPGPTPMHPRPPPPSWRTPQQLGSFHSQHRAPRNQRARSSSAGSGSDFSSGASSRAGRERRRLWTAVTTQRDRTRQLRGYLFQKRRESRALRDKKDHVDNAFMQLFRPQLTSSRPMAVLAVDLIRQKFEDMQLARDSYYAVQSEYETAEADLMHEESRLLGLEAELYRFLENEGHVDDEADTTSESDGSVRVFGSESDSDNSSDDGSEDDSGDDVASRISLLGISAVRQDDVHPLYAQLLDAAGDHNLAKEHHEEVQMQRDKILRDLEMVLHRERKRTDPLDPISEKELETLKSSLNDIPTDHKEFETKFGVEIDQDDLDFLRDYKAEEGRLRRRLEEASRKVERLEVLCRERGAMRRNAPYNEEYAIYADNNWATFVPESNLTLEPEGGLKHDLTHPRFPILLSNPSHVLELLTPQSALKRAMAGPADDPAVAQRRAECLKEYGIENLMKKADNKPDYINQWLIHRLRTTPLEVELMFSIFEQYFKVRNLRRWQEDVLYFWRQDEAANRLADDFGGPLTPRGDLESQNSIDGVNSAVLRSVRAKSETAEDSHLIHHRRTQSRHAQSLPDRL